MEWEVTGSKEVCTVCGRSFGEREEYWSAIFPADEGFLRRDYCHECWSGGPQEAFGFWRTRCRREPEPPKRFVNDETLLEFFRRLSACDDPQRRKLAFLMSVLLLRKRLLKERGRRRDESGLYWVLEAPALGERFEVRDEGLAGAEIDELMSQVEAVMNIDFERPDDEEG